MKQGFTAPARRRPTGQPSWPTGQPSWPTVALAFLAMAVGLGCRHGVDEDPILQLSASEALVEGKKLLEIEKFGQARKYLVHAFEVEPNSLQGREALLLVADAHFLEGGDDNEISAEAKYRDFLNRFPTSDRAAYVQFQIGNALAARMERPDRDQEVTVKALAAFEELLRIYPTTEYAGPAREKIREVRGNLATHELEVGRFYLRFGLPKAAQLRLEGLLASYPDYIGRDAALFYLGRAYQGLGLGEDAVRTFGDLRQQFPESRFVEEIGTVETPAPAAPAPAVAATSGGAGR